MSCISKTSEYARKNYLSQYRVFSVKNHHRATTHNRTDDRWVECRDCIDKRTCSRTERHFEMTCEAGIKNRPNYYLDEEEDKLYMDIAYRVNI